MFESISGLSNLAISSYLCTPTLITILEIFVILLLAGIAVIGLAIVNLPSFLGKNAPVPADVLVVEGWLPDYAIEAALTEFHDGGYKTLITVGAPLPRGFYLSEYKNFAELAGATLVALGVNPQQLVIVSTDNISQCRTQNAAIALKGYFETCESEIQSMNVFTLGPHARRTWLMFRRVFPSPMNLGIISANPLAYVSKKWWKSSEGVRTVTGELIAYVYIRFWG
jgi:hypothetical protein